MSLRTSIQRQRMTSRGGGILPPGFIECEYLEGDGNQWIDTGIKAEATMEVELEFQFTAGPTQDLFGDLTFTSQRISLYLGGAGNGAVYCYIGNAYGRVPVANFEKQHYYFNLTGDFRVDGNSYTTGKLTSYDRVGSLYLWREHCNTGQCRGKAFSLIIKKYDQEVLHIIPALAPDGRPCMFDLVSQTPFYNQGTGEFGYMTKDLVYVAPV